MSATTPIPAHIDILLVDDHTLFREGLRRMLDAEPGMRVSGDFATGTAALEAVRRGLRFDIALLDYELATGQPVMREPAPGASVHSTGLELLERIRELRPEARVLLVTAGMEVTDLTRAVQDLGAGVFLKTEPIAELMLAIERTARGERWISSGAALELLSQTAKTAPRRQHMTSRESQVLRGVLEGLSNKEIGAHMELSESAVKAVLQKLFEKTGVRSRSQLVRYAIEAERSSS
jgi:DNA-binding NarL/FixJ family response regulator